MVTQHKLNHVTIDQPSIKCTKLYKLFDYSFCVWLFEEKKGTEPNVQIFDRIFLRSNIYFCVWFFVLCLITYFCVWLYIFAFDCLFLHLTIRFCVWSFLFALAYLLLRSAVCFCDGINIQKQHIANWVNSWRPIVFKKSCVIVFPLIAVRVWNWENKIFMHWKFWWFLCTFVTKV